jgi:4-amino-4-deoxy-L-arabinose transferase-like glycosyltransferase
MRQMINVLPLVLAALLLTWMQTRFRSRWRAVGLFIFLLLIPPVVRYNIQFWHPDALVVLFVTLTLFFLDRDQFRYGADFYLAALFCGLAAATKLYGFFFFLAVGGYLIAGLVRGSLSWPAAFRRGLLFVLVMGLTIALSNPWLSDANARSRFRTILREKSNEMRYGYGETSADAIEFYRRGLVPTIKFLAPRYGSLAFLLFGTVSLIAAALRGPRRLTAWLILAWFAPMAIYFIWGMNYKSYHYWMPAMLPFLSGVTGLLDAADGETKPRRVVVWGVVAAVVLAQTVAFIVLSMPDWQQWL